MSDEDYNNILLPFPSYFLEEFQFHGWQFYYHLDEHYDEGCKDMAGDKSDLENLKKQIRIQSEQLSGFDCFNGTNKAYWALKYAYHAIGLIQEELRAEKNYKLADQMRYVRAVLHDGYTWRIFNDIDNVTGGKDE